MYWDGEKHTYVLAANQSNTENENAASAESQSSTSGSKEKKEKPKSKTAQQVLYIQDQSQLWRNGTSSEILLLFIFYLPFTF